MILFSAARTAGGRRVPGGCVDESAAFAAVERLFFLLLCFAFALVVEYGQHEQGDECQNERNLDELERIDGHQVVSSGV